MIDLVRDDHTAKFLLERSGPGIEFHPPFAGYVIMRGRLPMGAFILNGFNRSNVDFSGAMFARATIAVPRAIVRLCFGELGCVRMTARTRPSNLAANAILKACGFRLESVAVDHFGTENANVYALLKRDQKLVRL